MRSPRRRVRFPTMQPTTTDLSRSSTPWWSTSWTRTLIGLALIPAYVLLLHHFAYLSTDAVQTRSQGLAAALGDAALWGAVAMSGFGLLGILATAHFPNRRPAVPAWSLVVLMLLSMVSIWILTVLTIGASSLHDSPTPPSLVQRLHIGNWAHFLYIPVTLLVTGSALVQRLKGQRQRRQWSWIGFTLGTAPFFAATLLLAIEIGAELG